MGMQEEFRRNDTTCVLGDQEEPFYVYLADEVERRGTGAIDEMERCVFDGESAQYAVQLAMVWCGNSEDESTVARRLGVVRRVLREHPNHLVRTAAADALHAIRPDLLDAAYENETHPDVKYRIARLVIGDNMRGIVYSERKYVRGAKSLLGSVYPWLGPTFAGNQSMRKDKLAGAMKLFGVAKAAVLLHFICSHRFMTDETRQMVLQTMQDCAPQELLAAFHARGAE